MKIIQAMKQIKDLTKKVDDLKRKCQLYCADMDYETPVYANQTQQVSEWLQSASDCIKEIEKLRYRIQKTNLMTNVTIELGGKSITKSIAEWIHRRRDLATMEFNLWSSLTDKGLQAKEGLAKNTSGVDVQVRLRRYYDPALRDTKQELYRSEPSIIDANLEIVNAITDLQN